MLFSGRLSGKPNCKSINKQNSKNNNKSGLFDLLKTYATVVSLTPVLLVISINTVLTQTVGAAPADLAVGEYEIVSKRFDPRESRGINGNSQIEDVSRDGRYIAFNTEGSLTGATRSDTETLIFDRETGSVERFDPTPGRRSGNVMFSADGRILTFLSNSSVLVPDSGEVVNRFAPDLFTYDRLTDTYSRLTAGARIEYGKERSVQMSYDRELILFRALPGGPISTSGWFLLDPNTLSITRELDYSSFGVVLSGNGFVLSWYEFFDNRWDLRMRDLSSGETRTVAQDVSLETATLNGDGDTLVFPNRLANGNRGLFSYDWETAATTQLLAQANGDLRRAAFEPIGRRLLIESTATNLTGEPDPNGAGVDIFDYEVASGQVTRIARAKPSGLSLFSASSGAAVVVFEDDANVYDADDPNGGYSDVFVWTRATGDIRRVSNTVEPYLLRGGDEDSGDGQISSNGRFVAYRSAATNLIEGTLVEGTTSDRQDVYHYDALTGSTRNLTAGGSINSGPPSISDNGELVVFASQAGDIVPGDNNSATDLFLYNHSDGIVENLTVSLPNLNIIAEFRPRISGDGTRIVYGSFDGLRAFDRATGVVTELPYEAGFGSRQASVELSGDGILLLYNEGGFSDKPVVIHNLVTNQAIETATYNGELVGATNAKMSGDGRFVVFDSQSALTSNPPRASGGVFLWDRQLNSYQFLGGGNNKRNQFDVSADGTAVVFRSFGILAANEAFQCGWAFNEGPAFRYVIATGETSLTSCIETTAPGNVVGGLEIDGSGELMLGTIWDWFVKTDVDARRNVFLLRVAAATTGNNNAPVALAQSVVVGADGSAGITLQGRDDDGDILGFAVVAPPVNGDLSGSAPNLVYQPRAGFTGSDSFTFTVNDGLVASDAALVDISVVGSSSLGLTAELRPGSRTVDLQAMFPTTAVWTQVRVFDGPSSVLWDGQGTSWTGSYTVAPGVESVSFNARYWLSGEVSASDDTTVEVSLAGGPSDGLTLTGFAWIDGNADSVREATEAGDVGRSVDLYRCGPPWGIAGSASTQAPDGQFSISGLEAGEYQIGTPATGVEFSAPINDNVVYPTGFSNCFTVDGNHSPIGIGLLSADLPRISVGGFAWIDSDANSVRDSDEANVAGRAVTMYRCAEPWGIVGEGVTGADGNFSIEGVLPGEYQFGTPTTGVSFSPVQRDNLIHPAGFSNCVDFNAGPRLIGIGLLP